MKLSSAVSLDCIARGKLFHMSVVDVVGVRAESGTAGEVQGSSIGTTGCEGGD